MSEGVYLLVKVSATFIKLQGNLLTLFLKPVFLCHKTLDLVDYDVMP
jgi:hypothetical protein